MPDLSSGRRTAATALLDAMGDPGKVVDRGTILPLGTYEDGSTGLAWPSVLYDPVKSVGRLWDNAPAAADPSASPEVMSQTGEDLFNIGGSVGLGGFAAPKPSNSLGVFGGRIGAGNLAKKGIHGPQQALDMAERMKAEGRTPLEIYQATSQHLEGTPYAGIHWGADGKPRFEISDLPNEIYPADYGPTIEDGGLQLKMGDPKSTLFGGKSYWDATQTGISGPLVSHGDLAAAYPEMSGMSVNIQSSNKIKESGAGMTRSGNIRAFSPNVKSTATQDYDAANTDWLRSALAHELDHKAASIEGFSPGGNAAEMRSHPYYTGEKNMFESLGGQPEEASLYELLAGETQARNTQDRLHMSATDRRATPPWLTQENPYHAQIEPPEGFLQRWLNPWLPAGSKFGTKAADERSQRLFDRKDETPTPSILGREKSQRTQGRSQYDFQKEASTEWPNFPGNKNVGGMYGEPKSVVMIDGRPATVDDFTSEWMKIGGLEDMAMSNGSLPDYLKLHAERWGTNANPDYISGMTELSGLVKAGRLHIVPYDYYQSWAADNVSLGSRALPSPNLYSNDSRASLPYLAGQAADNASALPMDQASRLARAKEMGFDTENVLYHGTHPSNIGPGGERRYRAADFESFDSGFLGDNSGLTPGFSFSSSPENASGYAGLDSIVEWNQEFNSKLSAAYDKAYGKKRLSKDHRAQAIRDHADLVKKAHESDMNDPFIATWKDTQIEGGAVYPVHLRHGRQMVIDAEGSLWKNINGTRVQELAKKAKEDGYDSLVVKNVRDAGNARQASQGLLSDTTIIFDPKNIRSVNAAFDPAMSDSANLLAANGRNSSLPYLTGQALDNRAASALLDEGPKGFTAYHGSPHDFDKFDMSKIGTGEGAQAYGHGLYFAESEGVAQSYRDGLSPGSFAIDGTSVQQTAMPWLKEYMTRDDKSLASVLTRINNGISSRESRRSSLAKEKGNKTAAHIGESLKKEIEIERNRADALRSYLNEKQDANAGWNSNGHMYQVRINANPDDFLDWDKPLSQQPRAAEILKSLQLPMGAIDDLGGDVSLLHNSEMPREFYDALSSLSGVGDVSGASKLIGEAGIPGIKYLDQGSRTAGEGSRNYVLFRDDIIDIVKKYGIAAAALMYGEQAVQSAMDSGASVQTDY